MCGYTYTCVCGGVCTDMYTLIYLYVIRRECVYTYMYVYDYLCILIDLYKWTGLGVGLHFDWHI